MCNFLSGTRNRVKRGIHVITAGSRRCIDNHIGWCRYSRTIAVKYKCYFIGITPNPTIADISTGNVSGLSRVGYSRKKNYDQKEQEIPPKAISNVLQPSFPTQKNLILI